MKTVILTGANGNLGTVVTKMFLDKGYRVLATLNSPIDPDKLLKHDNLEWTVVNLTDETTTRTFVEAAILKQGKIDAAVLLAGGFAMGQIDATGLGDLKSQFSLNFDTAYTVTRALFGHMLENKRGRIVFVGSRSALIPSQGFRTLAYGLSKSLLFKLAEYLNEEASGIDVTASVVVPSTIDTAANRKSMPSADFSKWVKPEALAVTLEFILSESSSSLRQAVLKLYNDA
jgi:NAD(P)-dependent dehydrogenase (short-subunit alcohol dehydrogenase family)